MNQPLLSESIGQQDPGNDSVRCSMNSPFFNELKETLEELESISKERALATYTNLRNTEIDQNDAKLFIKIIDKFLSQKLTRSEAIMFMSKISGSEESAHDILSVFGSFS